MDLRSFILSVTDAAALMKTRRINRMGACQLRVTVALDHREPETSTIVRMKYQAEDYSVIVKHKAKCASPGGGDTPRGPCQTFTSVCGRF